MSKIIIFGDCHIGDYPNARQVESEIDSAFYQIREYERNLDGFVERGFSVGDIVRKKKGVPQLSIEILRKIKNYLSGYVAISGNHDHNKDNYFELYSSYCSTSDSVAHLSPYLQCLDNETITVNRTNGKIGVSGIPFYRNNECFYKALEFRVSRLDKKIKNILLIHQTPNTTPFSENCSDTIDINHELFNKFDLIICGHIHEHKQLSDKFWQIGSLVPMNATEIGQKYFLSVDTKTLEVKAIPLKQNITFSEKTKIENNSKLSKKVVEKAKEFDLLDAAVKYAEQNEFTDFQKNHSQNTILQAKKI